MRFKQGFLFTVGAFIPLTIFSNSTSSEFSKEKANILKTLENIKSYEITISYTEKVKGVKALMFAMQSTSQASVKYKKPNLLFINSVGKNERGSGQNAIVQDISIYCSFDGKNQKVRVSSTQNGKKTQQSFIMDASINSPDNPFDGWNLRGIGLAEGTEYIGTIKGMLKTYDFTKVNSKKNITEYKGTINVRKLASEFSKTMGKEQAKAFATIQANMIKELRIKVETKRHLVVGFTQVDAYERTCKFQNIKINPKLDDSIFEFSELPNEKFSDITNRVKQSRAMSQKMLKPKEKNKSEEQKSQPK